jgi:hypothetical protein
MRRTLRSLAICALAFSILEASYSVARLATTSEAVFAIVPQLLRTTNVALGLATAVVALVATAQERRWWRAGAFGSLALLIPYAGYLSSLLSSLVPALNSLSEDAGWKLFLLSYAVPTIVTAVLILANEMRPRSSFSQPPPAHEHDEGLELHFSSLDS